MVKAVVRDGTLGVGRVAARRRATRSRSPTWSPRCCSPARACTPSARSGPGLPRIVSSLFQVTVVALIFALVNGEQYSSYYIFYGTLIFADRPTWSRCAGRYERSRACCCAPPATGAARCSSARASTSRTSHHALVDEVARAGRDGRLHLAHAAARQRAALARARSRTCRRCSTRHRVQEVIIADPDFPEERAVELVDQCHRRGVTVRIAPSTMEILVHRAEFVPGASVPLFELRPPVFDGFDYFAQAHVRLRRRAAAADRALARCWS